MLVITSIAMHLHLCLQGRKGDKQIVAEAGVRAISVLYEQLSDITSSSPARYVLHSVTDAQLAGAMVFSGNTLLLKSTREPGPGGIAQ